MKKKVDKAATISRLNAVKNEIKTVDTAAVISRILTEDVISISQARAELGNITGVRPDKGTMTRWYRRGVGGVKLEVICLGSRNIFTSIQALTRFIEARTKTLSN